MKLIRHNRGMTAERNKQVVRILRIIQLLTSNRSGYTVKELLNKLNEEGLKCEERTVYRDIEAIEMVHFPIVKEESIYKLKDGAKASIPLDFSYPELLALFIARKSLGTLAESPFNEPLESIFNKIETSLGKGVVDLASELTPFFDFQLSPSWGVHVPNEVMSTIEKGCAEGQALKIEYRSPSTEPGWGYTDLRVGPEYIIFTHDGAYLYAKRIDTKEFRLYAFPRIRSAVLLEEPYVAEFQGDEKVHKDSFGVLTIGEVSAVELVITEPMASYISERKWHASQQMIRTEKGITLNLEVRVNDELARWVLGLGPSAKVVAPSELKQRVQELAKEIASAK
jgi:predicted DNA-binding transcriptional regulator YafY